MKVRIAFGLGAGTYLNDPGAFAAIVDQLEDEGWDSLWLSERAGGPAPCWGCCGAGWRGSS